MLISPCFGCRSQCFGGPHSSEEMPLGGYNLTGFLLGGGAQTRLCVVWRKARYSTCVCQFNCRFPTCTSQCFVCAIWCLKSMRDGFCSGWSRKQRIPFHPDVLQEEWTSFPNYFFVVAIFTLFVYVWRLYSLLLLSSLLGQYKSALCPLWCISVT